MNELLLYRLYRRLGARIRELRTGRGWTQEQLAEQAGIHVTFVSGIERGRRICSLKRLARLAAAK